MSRPSTRITFLSPGPSAKTTGQVLSADVNYPPSWSFVNNSSPATGQLPYQLNVNCAGSYDPDGFIIWAAIDWGDGSSELLATLPPSNVAITSLHSYTAPGIYTVTLSLIDNGRMAPGTLLDPTPPANDPASALTAIRALQNSQIDNGVLAATFDDPKYLPILRQDFLESTNPGQFACRQRHQFSLNFTKIEHRLIRIHVPSEWTRDQRFGCTVFPFSWVPARIILILSQFITDLKGNYFNSAQGLKFSITPKKRQMSFQIKAGNLQSAFQIANTTVVNGYVDVPVKIIITSATSGTTALATKSALCLQCKTE